MADIYRMANSADTKSADALIYSTHPAAPGTYIVYVNKDGSTTRTVVVLWGVEGDGSAVPITLSGVWDGVGNENNCVLHPDGTCGKFEQGWPNLAEAIEALREYGD
jgi:hypothetical protein